ncbi:MAG TPA: NADH-quinone oxidoreductase subunit A [Planctomycetota bacterium]|nr:NADH-quinone oxidoreductase subunit A [Planctomycetota bacterium]
MNFDFATVLVYVLVSMGFIFGSMTLGRILRPNRPTPEKLTTYECGEEAIGSAWIQFNVRFYIVALIFLIFDVEIAILFPWATIFKNHGMGLLVLGEILLFTLILVVGFVYVWVKGDLEWLKSLGEVKTEPRNLDS